MLNKEYYAKEIVDIVTSEDSWNIAVDIHTKKPCKCTALGCNNCLLCGDCKGLRNKWANSEYVEPIKLTLAEKIILENIDEIIEWITRGNDGKLICYEAKPIKGNKFWYRNNGYIIHLPLSNLFKFIKQEDDEPYKIEDILSNYEVIKDVD